MSVCFLAHKSWRVNEVIKIMSEYSEKFKSFPSSKLLRIIEEADSYQVEAVEAAKIELVTRNLSEDEIQSLEEEVSRTKAEEKVKEQRFESVKVKQLAWEII